jgi:predicted site-specific integrase-resolvase
MYVTTRDYQKLYGVSVITLRRWADSGKIESIRSPGNQRLYKVPEEKPRETPRKERIVYIRVSSPKQKDDLERQRAYMASRYPDHEIVSDIGSGINWKRKGLLTILDSAMQGNIEEVVVASRDRLCRFAFELIEWILRQAGSKLVVLEQTDQSPERELSDDLLSIVQIFCCRRNGKRRYNNVHNEESQIKSDKGAEICTQEVC